MCCISPRRFVRTIAKACWSGLSSDFGTPDDRDWTLVATSLVEAGVNLSFASPFRERFTTASLIQVGGRANRHGELANPAIVTDFFIDTDGQLTRHPGAAGSGAVLGELFEQDWFSRPFQPASLVTEAMRREVRKVGVATNQLLVSERNRDYPEVARRGRVIDADTRLVVVDPDLRDRLERREDVTARQLLGGSVQIWVHQIQRRALEPIPGRPEVFWWPYPYDSSLLGYMAGVL